MISNDSPDLERRLEHLIHAIKLVYASTYYRGPKAFSKRVGHRTEEEQMAVIIQKLVGSRYHDSFYPAISGVAQSYNYYPFARMKPEEGIVTIAMGLGKTVVEGEKTLRFSPVHPQLLPQRSTVDDILENAQRFFYALKMEADAIRWPPMMRLACGTAKWPRPMTNSPCSSWPVPMCPTNTASGIRSISRVYAS